MAANDPARPATEVDHPCAWRDAIIDACVIDWILIKEHEHDPRRAVNDLLCWQQKIALDPAVSKEAHDLYARIAELEAAAPPEGITALLERWQIEDAEDLADCPFGKPTLGWYGRKQRTDELAAALRPDKETSC